MEFRLGGAALKQLFTAVGVFWLVVFLHSSVFPQAGSPIIRNFPPSSYASSSYQTSPQNFALIQDRNGLIYVANEHVVLAFNGKHWQSIAGTESKHCFKFAIGKDGSVYSGGIDELGRFSEDSLGQIHFVSLKDRIPEGDRKIGFVFNVVSDKDGNVFFVEKERMFLWNGKEIRSWKSKIAFRKAVVVNGRAMFQSKEDGLWVFRDDSLVKVQGSDIVNSLPIKGIHLQGPNLPDEYFLVTYDQGLYGFGHGQMRSIPSPLDSVVVWNSADTGDGKIALATEAHGLCVLDKRNLSMESITEDQGIVFNSLLFPYVDSEGILWVTSDIGLSNLAYPGALRKIAPLTKTKIQAHSMFQHEGHLFVGMVDGSWRLRHSSGRLQMDKIAGTNDLVRTMVPFGNELLIGVANIGLFSQKGDDISKISDLGPTAILNSLRVPNRLFLGMETGIALLQKEKAGWKEENSVSAIQHPVYSLAETPNGDVWAAFTTVSRLRFPNGYDAPPIVTTFDSSQGFTADHGDYDLWVHEGKLYFGTGRGLFSFDEKSQRLVPDATFGERFADKGHAAHYMVEDLLGNIWLYDGERTGFLHKDPESKWQWNDLPLRRMEDQTVWSIYPSPDSLIWIGTTTTLYCYDPRIPKDYHVPFHTLIDRVTVNDTQVVFYGNYADEKGLLTDVQPDNYKLTFPFERNNIAFSYTATSYEYPEKTVFSHWLEGLEDGWSPWGPESDKAYNDLPEGTYTFHARSKNLYDTLGKEAAYTFTILPPWYRTWWAYTLYVCAAIGVVVLIVRWQVGRANRKQEAARALERGQQRAILLATVETQESERMRIARDLHDEIGAMLSTVKMSLKLSQRKLAKEGVDITLGESTELLDSVIGSVREISHDLLPPSLETLGLAAALGQLAEKTGQLSGIPFSCMVTGEPRRLPIRTELTLYRVVQEMISNSLKHSQATERGLEVAFEKEQLRIVFRDNGVGFDLEAVKGSGNGLGLRGMESRVDALGGELRMRSAVGAGFRAEILLRG